MSRNLASKNRPLDSSPRREAAFITCDGCCRPIERSADLVTMVHRLVLVRGFCSECTARMVVEFQRRSPHAASAPRRRPRSQNTSPLRWLSRAIGHTWAHRSARFPGEPTIQINTARMTGLLVTFGGLTLIVTLLSLLRGTGLSGFLIIVWLLLLLLLELRLISYFRYERHVREPVTEERP
jgi:hypothetical protein